MVEKKTRRILLNVHDIREETNGKTVKYFIDSRSGNEKTEIKTLKDLMDYFDA